jgi:glucosamine kinase
MGKMKLVFDSGGTKTSFGSTCDSEIFEGNSLHPRRLLDLQGQELNEWREQLKPFGDHQVVFYGAGCGAQASRDRIQDFFKQFGFREVEVYPDTIGACRALWGSQEGVAAILGTGSVCMEYDGKDVIARHGGYGPLIGDEGSGFYFGKLLVQKLLQDHTDLPEDVSNRFNKDALLAMLSAPDAIQQLARLAKLTYDLNLDWIHRMNLIKFFETYLPEVNLDKRKLGVVGGYGFAYKKLILEICSENGWELNTVIEKPIIQLLDYHK